MKKFERGKINRNSNSGFTLVELIVVLVILAILAAILVPALLGWIDKAREKKDLVEAKNCLTAAQTCLTEEYAKNSQNLKPGYNNPENIITPGKNGEGGAINSRGDVNSTGNKAKPNSFSDRVLNLADQKDHLERTSDVNNTDDPLVVIFGVGSNLEGSNATLHEKYTIYYFMYQKDVKSTAWFYFNGEWTTKNPRTDSSLIKDKYYPQVGPLKGKRIQYYIISNKLIEKYKPIKPGNYTGASSDFWNYVDQFNK